jgi:hypothetical protein
MIHACETPSHSLLLGYRGRGYTDCYVIELPFPITFAEFVAAFYTTPLFKVERFLLAQVLRLPSTDAQALELAAGTRESFAAWSVEAREVNQTVLAAGRTRSWLSVLPNKSSGTQLFFGSAVVARRSSSGAQNMGFWFWALGGFHKLYSRALLRAASNRLLSQAKAGARTDSAA